MQGTPGIPRLVLWILAAVSLLLCMVQLLMIGLQRALGEIRIAELGPYELGGSIWLPVVLTAIVPAVQLGVDVGEWMRRRGRGGDVVVPQR